MGQLVHGEREDIKNQIAAAHLVIVSLISSETRFTTTVRRKGRGNGC